MANQNTLGFIAKPRNPEYSVGKKHRNVQATPSLVSASMANGDTVVLAGPLTFDERIARVFTPNASPALTAAVANLGFMMKGTDGSLVEIKTGGSAVLWNATTALATAQSTRDLLLSINPALDTTKSIGDLLALSSEFEPAGGVYLVLTFSTKPSVNGVLDLDIAIEEATTR